MAAHAFLAFLLAIGHFFSAAVAYYQQNVTWVDESGGKTPLAASNVSLWTSEPVIGPNMIGIFIVTGSVNQNISDYVAGAAELQIWEIGLPVSFRASILSRSPTRAANYASRVLFLLWIFKYYVSTFWSVHVLA
jgi:hypothetical protein